MRRGDIVTAAFPGDYGKPRPALVIETDLLPGTDSVLLCLITSKVREEIVQRRILIEPSVENGLQVRSQITVEKIVAVKRVKCGEIIGRLERDALDRLNQSLALVVGLLD
jgi:mRNA interferase MazF